METKDYFSISLSFIALCVACASIFLNHRLTMGREKRDRLLDAISRALLSQSVFIHAYGSCLQFKWTHPNEPPGLGDPVIAELHRAFASLGTDVQVIQMVIGDRGILKNAMHELGMAFHRLTDPTKSIDDDWKNALHNQLSCQATLMAREYESIWNMHKYK
ncbi:MAG: hypothetical protein K8T91_18730 [Planctomycetes bacterium]|nr:hypothetical protein [Planctomycetota bacterium]